MFVLLRCWGDGGFRQAGDTVLIVLCLLVFRGRLFDLLPDDTGCCSNHIDGDVEAERFDDREKISVHELIEGLRTGVATRYDGHSDAPITPVRKHFIERQGSENAANGKTENVELGRRDGFKEHTQKLEYHTEESAEDKDFSHLFTTSFSDRHDNADNTGNNCSDATDIGHRSSGSYESITRRVAFSFGFLIDVGYSGRAGAKV